MAQMAPALTEANASPGSPRKNSVDRYCSSTYSDDLKQTTINKGVDLTLLSRNGFVRLLDDSTSSYITNTTGEQSLAVSSPPKSSIRNEDFNPWNMPNGHLPGFEEKEVVLSKSTNIRNDNSENRKPAILSHRACATITATTLTTSTGACDIDCDKEKNTRNTKHPVATLRFSKSLIPERSVKSVRNQARLESRARKLERRLRRLQTRQIETHVHRQLSGIVDHLKGKKHLDSTKIEGTSFGNILTKNEGLYSKEESVLSSACTSSEIDKGVIAFQAKDTRNAPSNTNLKENHFENAIKYSPESVNKAIKNALNDERQKFEAESLTEGLTAHVKHLEGMYDSDATEASSGEECEEDDQRSMM